jgi:hypothetical protein
VIVLPALALLAGAVIGVLLRNEPPPAAPPTTPAAQEQAPVVVTAIRDEGSTVRLTWIDPSGGEAVFIISQQTATGFRPVRTVPAGQTETIITGLDPDADQYCFRVLAVNGPQRSHSATMCTPVRTDAQP